jgi:hypothetical protein
VLNRFDGYEFKIFRNNSEDKNSPVPKIKKAVYFTIQNVLADNSIKSIVEGEM